MVHSPTFLLKCSHIHNLIRPFFIYGQFFDHDQERCAILNGHFGLFSYLCSILKEICILYTSRVNLRIHLCRPPIDNIPI